jgi:hypothetical protein
MKNIKLKFKNIALRITGLIIGVKILASIFMPTNKLTFEDVSAFTLLFFIALLVEGRVKGPIKINGVEIPLR